MFFLLGVLQSVFCSIFLMPLALLYVRDHENKVMVKIRLAIFDVMTKKWFVQQIQKSLLCVCRSLYNVLFMDLGFYRFPKPICKIFK